jgi:hypothetical protein
VTAIQITQDDLDWLLDHFSSNLWAFEHEYGGPYDYAADLEKARKIIENMKDILRGFD